MSEDQIGPEEISDADLEQVQAGIILFFQPDPTRTVSGAGVSPFRTSAFTHNRIFVESTTPVERVGANPTPHP